jgi:hypothetical protein
MSDNTLARRTLIPRLRMKPGALARGASVALSSLLAVAAVALVAFGISLIYIPAGVIAAGLGCLALQYQFFN